MPNAKITFESCKIQNFYKITDSSASGKIFWKEGSMEFSKNFMTYSPQVVKFIKNNLEGDFEVSGSFSKVEGRGEYKGKWFDLVTVQSVNLIK